MGGFAVIHHGYLRATEDIDLLWMGSLLLRMEQTHPEKTPTIAFSYSAPLQSWNVLTISRS